MTVDKSNPTYVVGAVRVRHENGVGTRVDKVGISKSQLGDVLFQNFLVTAAGDNTVITNVTSDQKIRVLGYHLSPGAGGEDVRWEDSAGNFLTGDAGAGGRFILAAGEALGFYSNYGLFETAAGEDLVLNIATGNDVPGVVTYCYV